MSEYIWAVSGAAIISALAAILLPEGRIGKFIKGILKLFCLAVMLTPLFSVAEQFLNGDLGAVAGGGDSSVSELDEQFIDAVFDSRAKEQAKEIDALLEDEFSVAVSAEVVWESVEYAYRVTDVNIKIENFGMYGSDEHIFIIGQIKDRVQELLPEAEVNVYE